MISGSPSAQRDRAAAFEAAGANLRAAQVLQDRDVAIGARAAAARMSIESARRGRPACRARSSGGTRRRRRRSSASSTAGASDAGPTVAMILVCLTVTCYLRSFRNRVSCSDGEHHASTVSTILLGCAAIRTNGWPRSIRRPRRRAAAGLSRHRRAAAHARAAAARRILEIGTAIGYSTLWMATALPADGALITMDTMRRAARAREHFADRRLRRSHQRDRRRRDAVPAQDVADRST